MLLSGAITHVGTPPAEQLADEHIVQLHDFTNLNKTKGKAIVSSIFLCAGNKWALQLYPGGSTNSKDGMVSIYLVNKTSSDIIARFGIIIMDSCGGIFFQGDSIKFCCFSGVDVWGFYDFIERDKILNASDKVLPRGTLAIKVHIKLHPDYVCHSLQPKCTLVQDVMSRFNVEVTADVAFRVMGKVIFAHKWILETRVPDLAVMCDGWDQFNPLPIDDVDPDLFKMMLKHEYGEQICAGSWKNKAEPILIAAAKYGFKQLKLEAEAWHVKNLKLTANNAVDCLLQADGNNLPLLKKVSMEFIITNTVEVVASESYSRLRESPTMTDEVILAMANQLSKSKKRKHGD